MSNQDVYNAPQSPWSYPRGLPQSWARVANTTQPDQQQQDQQPQQQQMPPLPQQQPATLAGLAGQAQQQDGGGFAGGDAQTQQPSGLPPHTDPQTPQRYVTSQRDRPPGDWGQPDWALQAADNYPGMPPGPNMPQGGDMWGLVHSISDGLGQGGSDYVNGSAKQMGMYATNMSKAYMEGQLYAYRVNAARMQQQLMQTAARQQEELQKYREAFAIYGPHKENDQTTDNPGDPDKLTNEIRGLSERYNDPVLKSALENGGVAAAERVLATRDGHSQDAEKILKMQILQARLKNLQQKNNTDTFAPYLEQPGGAASAAAPAPPQLGDRAPPPHWEEEATPEQKPGPDQPVETQGKPPSGDDAPEPLDWGTKEDGAEPPAPPPEAAPTSEDRPEDEPSEQQRSQAPIDQQHPLDRIAEDTGAQPHRRLFAQASPEDQARLQQQDPQRAPVPQSKALQDAYNTPIPGHPGAHLDVRQINDYAEKLLLGGGGLSRSEVTALTKSPVYQWIARRRQEMTEQIDALAASNLKGKPLLDALHKISPRMATGIEGVVAGTRDLPKGAALDRPPWNTALALMQKVDPSINANTIKTRASTLRYYTSGQGAQQLIRLGTAYGHSDALLKRIENQPSLMEGIRGAAGKVLPGAAKDRLFPETSSYVGALDADIRTLASEYNAIMAYGPGTKGERQSIAEELDWSRPNEAMGKIREMKRRLLDRENELKLGFERGTNMSYDQILHSIGQSKDGAEAATQLQNMQRDRSAAPPSQPGGVIDYREYFK